VVEVEPTQQNQVINGVLVDLEAEVEQVQIVIKQEQQEQLILEVVEAVELGNLVLFNVVVMVAQE
tara:strand:- start:344 stop:538 length:195 start_codon:yes stop_codon:yes gene_type:complete